MKDKEIINEIYENIADELNISNSVFENAERSYKALGEYLENNINYTVEVYPQGSMNLGTLIKPISDDDGNIKKFIVEYEPHNESGKCSSSSSSSMNLGGHQIWK